MTVRSLGDLASTISGDITLQGQLKTDPVGTIQKIAGQAQIPDTWVYRLVVLTLGIAVLVVVVGGFIFAARVGKEIPAALVSIGSAAVGALAGLLAPSPIARQ